MCLISVCRGHEASPAGCRLCVGCAGTVLVDYWIVKLRLVVAVKGRVYLSTGELPRAQDSAKCHFARDP